MRFLSKSLSVAVVAAMSVPALAQQTMEEVVVTATKRAESIQDVPLSVSVVTGEVIERAEVRDLLDLQSVVPSLRVPQFQNSIQTNFVIRGFGNGANNPGIEPSVAVLSMACISRAHRLAFQICPIFNRLRCSRALKARCMERTHQPA